MKYLCLVIVDEKKLNAMPRDDFHTLVDESLAYDNVLRKSGNFLAAHALEFVSSAKTIRALNGNTLVTDGPFAETREQIGGFILMEAQDLNEAVRLASKVPVLRLGAVEVRPVKELVASDQGGASAH